MSQTVPERPNFLFLWQELLRSKGEKPLKTPQQVYYIPDYTSESDPRSCKVTKQLQIKLRKKFGRSNGIQTHDLPDTGAMLYHLSYESSPEAGQVRVQFIPAMKRMRTWFVDDKDHTSALRLKNTSESDPRSYEVT